ATSGAGAIRRGGLSSSCGDSLLIDALGGHNIFFATLPNPNPVGMTEGDGISHFTLQAAVNGEATVELFDELGRTVSHNSFSLQAGQTKLCSFNLHDVPAGSYFYTVRYLSVFGTSTRNGSILVMH
ncbi:MAG: hypothetical protein ACHQNE_07565, partial [Candidatus Kapaibacterium sp.]